MQESVRRIIEAEEARMGKDYTSCLFCEFGGRKEQHRGWVVDGEKCKVSFLHFHP